MPYARQPPGHRAGARQPIVRRQRPPATPAAGAARRWRLELQVHPSDIRRRVRYLFFTRRQCALLVGAVVLWLAFVAAGGVLAPSVVRGFLSRHEHRNLVTERSRQGERLDALVARLERLEGRSGELRLKVDKIFLAYGLRGDESIGQGGFPPPERPVPQSVYANVIRQGNGLDARVGGELAVIATFLEELHAFEEANRELVRTTPSASPLRDDRFVLTSPFGNRRSPFTKSLDFHAGMDFAAPVGTPVHAPGDAKVVFAGRYPLRRSVGWWRYGNLVVLAHGDDFRTLFGHCEQIRVRAGQTVAQGDVIASVGSTGWSTSPHLHYEVRRRDEERKFVPVDPRIYMLDRRWRDEERLLVRARTAPPLTDYEPLPALLAN